MSGVRRFARTSTGSPSQQYRRNMGPRVLALLAFAVVPSLSANAADGPIQFNRDVRPILSNKCFACHGIDPKHRKADLRLDVADGLTAPLKGGRVAVIAGDPGKSELWKRINSA